MELVLGDCKEKLKELDDNSIDAIVTDPPYGLSFMGKKWDYDVPSIEVWQECLRVLKPGGYLLSFAGTRTQHRMAVNIEDAGFEIRDMIAWVYGSGFPKSLNIGKVVARLQGEDIPKTKGFNVAGQGIGLNPNKELRSDHPDYVKPTYDNEWDGWGTALKPALEPITVARKPLGEKTVAENCLKWGVGGINIDGCRVGTGEDKIKGGCKESDKGWNKLTNNNKKEATEHIYSTGRFPANLIHDGSDEVVGLFPQTKGATSRTDGKGVGMFASGNKEAGVIYPDSGSASRFFYCAKASKRERNKGVDCYLTVKYNNLCKEENTVVVQLLKRVISDTEVVSFSTGESGENITVQCHKDSLSTILTEINKIIELKILNSLTHSLTNESTQDVNSEKESGGNLVESVESLRKYLLTITKENRELALGASRVALQTLLSIKEKENWQEAKNFHSTVKPIALMEYLVKLVSREGQVVLDPFMGSGTTGMACKKLDRDFIGIEMMPEYMEIAKCRIDGVKKEDQLNMI